MKELFHCALLIWRYGVQYRGKAMNWQDRNGFLMMMVIVFAIASFYANWFDAIFFALTLPTFAYGYGLWKNYCSGAAALLAPGHAMLAPKMHDRARHAILLIWLLLTTVAALVIALRFGSFWLIFLPVGILLQPANKALDKRLANGANTNKPTQQAAMPQSRAKLLQQAFAKHAPQAQLADLLRAGSFLRGSIKIGSQEFNHIFLVPVIIGWMAKLVFWPDSANSQHLLGQVILIILALMQLTGINPFLYTIERTRPEQGLFRLSPLAPASQDFNLMLARHFVRAGMINWLYVTLLFMLYSTLFGVSSQILLAQFAACSIGLHKIAAPLCNYASLLNKLEHRPIEVNIDGLMIISMCFILALISWAVLGSITPPPEWTQHFLIWWSASLLLINVIHTARILPKRWRIMVAAPVAFPAGRLDD